jgi:hypothetical protein
MLNYFNIRHSKLQKKIYNIYIQRIFETDNKTTQVTVSTKEHF